VGRAVRPASCFANFVLLIAEVLPMKKSISPRLQWMLMLPSLLGVLACCLPPVQGQEKENENDEALKQRFLQEAPVKWREYSEKMNKVEGKLSYALTQTLGNVIVQNRYEVKKGNSGRVLVNLTIDRSDEGESKPTSIEAFGRNPNYAFVLSRVTPTSHWFVKKIIDAKDEALIHETAKPFVEEADMFMRDLVRVNPDYLPDLVAKPEFVVRNCRKVAQGATEYVEVSFSSHHDVKGGGDPVQGGVLILDPRQYWCVSSYVAQKKTPMLEGENHFQVLEYGESEGGIPLPKHAVSNNKNLIDGAPNEQKWTYEYDLSIPKEKAADEAFTLSAFGLPEPAGMGKRPIQWYLWAALAGIVCLFAAALLGWWVRRARTISNGPQPERP
jgi:hypothetical protein